MIRSTLICGDVIEQLALLPENSVDSVVTDPPYGLTARGGGEAGFMGKTWDGAAGFRRSLNAADAGRESVFGRTSRTSPEYGGGSVFQRFNEAWAREALRVLKPGGHLLAFGGSRTSHRLAVAIEDAGFEIRDQILWIYGSGFPKSLDVGKALNKTEPNTDAAKQWAGWGTALKPAHEPIVVARKPLSGTVAANVLEHGTGALNIGGCRVGTEPIPSNRLEVWSGFGEMKRPTYTQTMNAGRWPANVIHDGSDAVLEQFDKAGKPAHEPIVVARKPLDGTVAENVLEHGTGAMNIDACRVAYVTCGNGNLALNPHLRTHINGGNGGNIISHESERRVVTPNAAGRWPANVVHDGSDAVLGEFDKTGERTSDGPARFFYCAKASRTDRGEGNNHPTVKPNSLMRYLVRLVTPPGGLVLDPFMGSGSTGKAAVEEGFRFTGIDLDPDYVQLASNRIGQGDGNRNAGTEF